MAHWRSLVFHALIIAQERRCFLCGQRFNPAFCERPEVPEHQRQHPDRATFDHLRPKALFGPDHWSNINLAHARCNRAKASRLPTPEEFDRLQSIWASVSVSKRDEIQAQWERQRKQSWTDRRGGGDT